MSPTRQPCRIPRPRIAALAAVAALAASPAYAADELDALSLESAPAPQTTADSPLRVATELAVGRIDPRFGVDSRSGRRLSIDLRYATQIAPAWRLALSDRLDYSDPEPPGQRSAANSLREAYVTWQAPGGTTTADAGRVNLRQGPAFGYNPTDFFRHGALRTVTTADPVALREMRMGTGMLRATQLFESGSATLALAPKISDAPDDSPGALDFGATNSTHRALAGYSRRFSDRVNGQLSLLFERGREPALGLSGTALATDSLVAYGEWSSVETRTLLDQVLGTGARLYRVDQAAAGLTYTLPNSLAITVEAEFNGAGLDRAGWNRLLTGGPAAYARYARLTQGSQELGSRHAWLVYAQHRGAFTKQLDVTAFVRTNSVDDSRLGWLELRYHWPRFDAALQWQQASGKAGTEFGVMPYRRLVQVLGVFYL